MRSELNSLPPVAHAARYTRHSRTWGATDIDYKFEW